MEFEDALSSPEAVLAATRYVWGATPLPADESSETPFTLTLATASVVVLRASSSAFSHDTTMILGEAPPCEVGAVSDDGLWAHVVMPSPIDVCGSNETECGYAELSLTNPGGSGSEGASESGSSRVLKTTRTVSTLPSYNVSVACPPVCPSTLGIDGAALYADSTPGVVSLAIMPPTGSGGVPQPFPSALTPSASVGVFYTLACSQTGVYTDPITGACANASDPLSLRCAYGAGGGCRPCPVGGLCPGGSRLWTRAGYWVLSEASTDVTRCAPPRAELRCTGWTGTAGRTTCGAGYLPGSYLCSACTSGFFLEVRVVDMRLGVGPRYSLYCPATTAGRWGLWKLPTDDDGVGTLRRASPIYRSAYWCCALNCTPPCPSCQIRRRHSARDCRAYI